jgi:hypothetical protein
VTSRVAVLTDYHGARLTMRDLRLRVGIGDRTLARWHRQGRLNERTIDQYLTDRSERSASRALAAQNGVGRSAWSMRVMRGASYAAAALPRDQYRPICRQDPI